MSLPASLVWTKPALFLLCLVPAASLGWGIWHDTLGVNPLETLTRGTGEWTLRFLLLTLMITPLIRLLSRPELLNYRRMLGLFAFFYGSVHMLTYWWFDKFFDLDEVLLDIQERMFITAGMVAFTLLIPLAATSTRRAMRALGRRWNQLHRLVYVATAAGLLHFFWLTRADYLEPIVYTVIFAFLMLARIRRPSTISA